MGTTPPPPPPPQLGLFVLYVGGLNSGRTRKFLGANHAFVWRLVALPELNLLIFIVASFLVNNLKYVLRG